MRKEKRDRRDYYWTSESGLITTITPRVILREPNGYLPMIRHGDVLGLLGGHTQRRDMGPRWRKLLWNPLAHVRTVIRETKEESGVDIRPFLRRRLEFLGIVDILVVDMNRRLLINNITPILYTDIPGGLPFRPDIEKVHPRSIPVRTFPDASLGLFRLFTLEDAGLMRFHVEPVPLNVGEEIVYRTGDRQEYIRGEPPYHLEGYPRRAPAIPRTLPPSMRHWLRDQYARRY